MSIEWYERNYGGYAWTTGKFRSAKLTPKQRKLLRDLTLEVVGERAEFSAIVGLVNRRAVERNMEDLGRLSPSLPRSGADGTVERGGTSTKRYH